MTEVEDCRRVALSGLVYVRVRLGDEWVCVHRDDVELLFFADADPDAPAEGQPVQESGSVQGRWTIRPHPQSWPSWSYADGPRPGGVVPVVPCDDAAVERAREAIIASTDCVPSGAEGFPGWSLVLAERVLAAAGRAG